MVSKRLIHEAGHQPKILVIVDETPECCRAVLYAAMRAFHSNDKLILLYVINHNHFQHWIGVENIMRSEALEEAKNQLDRQAKFVKDTTDIEPELIIRQGSITIEIAKLIEEDRDISIMVLAASSINEEPGPLVSSVAGTGAAFPIPVIVIPNSLSDDDIKSLV